MSVHITLLCAAVMALPLALCWPSRWQVTQTPTSACRLYKPSGMCRKLVALFGLAQQLLSRQQHYDWGLRALKTCLAVAGRLMREHRAAAQQVVQQTEVQLVIRGVRLATMPKLTFEDTSRCFAQKFYQFCAWMVSRTDVGSDIHVQSSLLLPASHSDIAHASLMQLQVAGTKVASRHLLGG